MHSGHSDKIKMTRDGNIHQVYANDINGLPAFYFIAVDNTKRKAFEKAIVKGDCDLTAYGEIVLSGYGLPTEKDRLFMKERHQYDVED